MDIRKLQRAIVDGLEDVKGQNIVVFNTEHLSALFERVVIASGTSNRQTKALAASVRDAVKAQGFGPTRTEGEANGEWIIVDCGAAVVHLMQPGIREYYHLEEIWGDKPVKLKLDTAPARLVKASEPAPVAKVAPAAKKAGAKKAAPKKAEASSTQAKAAPKKRAPAAKAPAAKNAKAASERAPARKAAPTKRVVVKSVTPMSPVSRAAAPAAKKAPARKAAPVRKAVTRTVGVKTTRAAAGVAAKPSPVRRPAAAKPATPARKTVSRKA